MYMSDRWYMVLKSTMRDFVKEIADLFFFMVTAGIVIWNQPKENYPFLDSIIKFDNALMSCVVIAGVLLFSQGIKLVVCGVFMLLQKLYRLIFKKHYKQA
jgi:hypothetical protein